MKKSYFVPLTSYFGSLMVEEFKKSSLYAFGLYGAVGIQLAASVVAGLAFGNYIDKKLGTSPWLALLGTILGAVGGIWNLVRIMKWGEKKDQACPPKQ